MPDLLLGLVPLTAAFVAHWPIIGAPFFEDDFLHLYNLQNGSLPEFLVTPHGGHLLVIRNFVFFLSHAVFGLHTEGYMWVVLLTHMLNSYLLYRILVVQTGSPWNACAGSTVWAAAQIHRGVLGWYSAYAQALAGAALLSALHVTLTARPGMVSTRRWIGCATILLIGSMCFGVGISLALVFWLVAALEIPEGAQRRRAIAVLAPLVVIVPLLYVLSRWLYRWLSGLSPEATPIDRLLATWRLWFGMTKWLLAHGSVSFAFGGVLWMSPDRELAFLWVGGALCLVAVAFSRRKGSWRHALSWALITVASYAMISVGSAETWVEGFATTLQDAAVEPRYHYVGQIGLCGVLCVAAATIGSLPLVLRRAALVLVFAYSLAIVGFNVRGEHAGPICINCKLASSWQTTFDRSGERELARVSGSLRDRIHAANADHVCIPNRAFKEMAFDAGHTSRFPGWAAIFVITFPDNVVDGKRVYFVEPDAGVRSFAQARLGHRIASLLVEPGRCPGA